jgi:SAM-dependent methyltransferase
MGNYDAFGDMELAGWSDAARASAYVDLFASASDQAIPDLLAAVGAAPGLRVLDLCCGQGNVSEALVAAGCAVVGADFSPAMIALAESRVPGATFVEADAQDLPFDAGAFDAVVSNLGVCHVADQPHALAEVRRVLRDRGRFGMTVWCGPDVSPAFATFYGAVRRHGHPDVTLPDGPDFHQFARRDDAAALLTAAGFADVELATVDCYWDLPAPDALAGIFENGTVRAAMLLSGQPAENLSAIRRDMEAAVRERFAVDGHWHVPVPAALVRAEAAKA